jgi:hypothetical protein
MFEFLLLNSNLPFKQFHAHVSCLSYIFPGKQVVAT